MDIDEEDGQNVVAQLNVVEANAVYLLIDRMSRVGAVPHQGSTSYGRSYVAPSDLVVTAETISAGLNGSTAAVRSVGGKRVHDLIIKTPRAVKNCGAKVGRNRAELERYLFDCSDPLSFEYLNHASLHPLRRVCPNFEMVHGYFWTRGHLEDGRLRDSGAEEKEGEPTVLRPVMLAERVRPGITVQDECKTSSAVEVTTLLLQVMLACEVAYQYNGFTHYDLHTKNVLVRDLDEPDTLTYTIDGLEYTLDAMQHAVIIDAARAYVSDRREVAEVHGMGGDARHYDPDRNDHWLLYKYQPGWTFYVRRPHRTYDMVVFCHAFIASVRRRFLDPASRWHDRRLAAFAADFMRDHPRAQGRNKYHTHTPSLNGTHGGSAFRRPLDVYSWFSRFRDANPGYDDAEFERLNGAHPPDGGAPSEATGGDEALQGKAV